MSKAIGDAVSAQQIEDTLFQHRVIGVVHEGRLVIIAPAAKFGQSPQKLFSTRMEAGEGPRELELNDCEGQAVTVAFQTGSTELWGAKLVGVVDPAVACLIVQNHALRIGRPQ